MISIRNLNVQYEDIQALQDISLDIGEGDCVLVTGPSGCGKSTLARVLCGLIPHAIPAFVRGQILVDGLDPRIRSIPEMAQHVGMVFQRPASQLFHLRVEDEVSFGPRNLGLSEGEIKERTEWALKVTGMYDLRNEKPTQLSGGQKQCLAIAAALAMRTKILVLDEPTASLDVPNTRRVIETLSTLHKDYRITILLIEHRLAEVAQLAQRVILMEKGRIISNSDSPDIFSDRQLRLRLGLRRPVEEPSISWENLIKSNGDYPKQQKPLLELQGVTAGFNGHAVISDIHLCFYPGEFIALVGDNGAGKSTLAMVVAGLIKPISGKVRYKDGSKPQPGLDVGLLFQDPQDQLFTDSVREEITFGPINYGRQDYQKIDEILQQADLSDMPTLGQDWGHLQRLMDYLKVLQHQGITILLITHDYKLVHRYAEKILLLRDGCIEMIGRTTKENKNETFHA
jgi:energy-coupling factor transporter ATP-binding protein EcfA2